LRRLAPGLSVELVSAPTEVRLDRVRSGQLDAAFVRGLSDAPPDLRLTPVWLDELVVALSARHHLARRDRIDFGDLAEIPLRIVPRRANQPLVDLVMGACAHAGFEPVLYGDASNLADTLAAIGSAADTWTIMYAAHARNLRTSRVAFRPVDPSMTMPTLLVTRPAGSGSIELLLEACRTVGNDHVP
jgi:DNA-binding transcriptional LysR family regulator